jgi:hypothetical protein
MKTKVLTAIAAVTIVLAGQASAASAAVKALGGKPCAEITKWIKSNVTAENATDMVAEILEVAPKCACVVIGDIIRTVKADDELAAAIVESAIKAHPNLASTVADCAAKAAPSAADEIKAIVKKTFEDKDGETENGEAPTAIGGVYLVFPGTAGGLNNDGSRLTVDSRGRRVLIGPDGQTIVLSEGTTTTGRGGRTPRTPAAGGGGTPTPVGN